jgi:hypothetical protein
MMNVVMKMSVTRMAAEHGCRLRGYRGLEYYASLDLFEKNPSLINPGTATIPFAHGHHRLL